MTRLIPVNSKTEILPEYRNTPVEQLLLYHNLAELLPKTTVHAELIIGMCMDHRKDLTIPNEFAYVLRTAGGNLRGCEFEISYAIAIGKVNTIALLAHTDCGMSHVMEKRTAFINGLIERAGCSSEAAANQFDKNAETYFIGDPVNFVMN
ncbi:MAG: carbonic anhydrase, partial [Acidobacteriota bacterium]